MPDQTRRAPGVAGGSQITQLGGSLIGNHRTAPPHDPRCGLACDSSGCSYRSCLVPVDRDITETVVDLMGIAS